jgi:hypothetical protein
LGDRPDYALSACFSGTGWSHLEGRNSAAMVKVKVAEEVTIRGVLRPPVLS